jgi:hypothetical protein
MVDTASFSRPPTTGRCCRKFHRLVFVSTAHATHVAAHTEVHVLTSVLVAFFHWPSVFSQVPSQYMHLCVCVFVGEGVYGWVLC